MVSIRAPRLLWTAGCTRRSPPVTGLDPRRVQALATDGSVRTSALAILRGEPTSEQPPAERRQRAARPFPGSGPRRNAMLLESRAMADLPGSAAQDELSALARLVQQAQRGDSAAFASIHARFAGSVHAVLLARLSPADADDGLQETFVLAWKRLDALRDPDAVGPWLHAIARNVARDRRRDLGEAGEVPIELSTRV